MGIELKCPQCQKLIRAPNDAGGRRGKCPYCKKSIYIPIPADEGEEEIGIAPLDADEERQAAELRQETIRFAAGVDRADPGSPNDIAGETGPETDIRADVQSFLIAMRDSKLDDAETTVKRLRHARAKTRDYVQSLLGDESAAAIEGVPPPVLKGFLESLLNRLD